MLCTGGRRTCVLATWGLVIATCLHTASCCGPDPLEELLDNLINPLTMSCLDGRYAGNNAACSADPYCAFEGVCAPDAAALGQLRSDRTGRLAMEAYCAAVNPAPPINVAEPCRDLPYPYYSPCDVVYAQPATWTGASCVVSGNFVSMFQNEKAGWDACMQQMQAQAGGMPPQHYPGGPGPDGGSEANTLCMPGWEPVQVMMRTRHPDGSESLMPGTDCRECPFIERCDGNGCSAGSGGAGCAYCDNGANGTTQHYESGSECKPCPDSQASNVFAAVLGIGVVFLLSVYIWQISTVSGGEEGTAATAALESAEEAKGNAETVAELRGAVATLSSTAIVASIALPSLFNITITFQLPSLGMPALLAGLGAFISEIVAIDVGKLGAPECTMETPNALSVFKIKFYLTNVGFFLVVIVLSMKGVCTDQLHATNARIAAYTLAAGGLVKSCVRCLACQEEVLGTYVNDGSARVVLIALPDEECWTDEHFSLAILAAAGLVLYMVIIPATLFCKARKAASDDDWSEDELKQYGWLVLKYKPSRWYFEFVLLVDKMIFALLAVFFASERSVQLLLGFNLVFSIALLAFVAHDKPYRSEDGEEERLCMEDKMMILSQILQICTYAVAWVCYSDTIARRDYVPDYANGEQPLTGLSPGVELFAAAFGLAAVIIQIGSIWYAGRGGDDDNDNEDLDKEGDAAAEFVVSNPANRDE